MLSDAQSSTTVTVTRTIDLDWMAEIGRRGAAATHSRHDPHKTTAAGRAAFRRRFERQVDPDHALPPDEREARVRLAMSEHFRRLAKTSAEVRRQRASERLRASTEVA